MSGDEDYYALLGVSAEIDALELRRIWRQLALQWHPDRAGDAATAMFQRLSVAYETLSNPVTRSAYDRARGVITMRPAPASPPGVRAPAMLLVRVSGTLGSLLARGIARRAGDMIDLILLPNEAHTGGMITITLAVPVACPWCTDARFGGCATCGDLRMIEDLVSVWLAVRPGCRDGEVLTPSAQLAGLLFRARVHP